MSRVLSGENQITQKYKEGVHNGIDLVKKTASLSDIIAHSDGEVVAIRNDYKTQDKNGNSYGNYVKIRHNDGRYTLYAHLKYESVCVSVGDKVTTGQKIGYMGATGHATGGHLHFEVRNANNVRIDPTEYIDGGSFDVVTPEPTPEPVKTHFNIGDTVTVNGVGKSNSYGGGFSTKRYRNTKMYVMNYKDDGRAYPYALSTNNKQVTAWFKEESVS